MKRLETWSCPLLLLYRRCQGFRGFSGLRKQGLRGVEGTNAGGFFPLRRSGAQVSRHPFRTSTIQSRHWKGRGREPEPDPGGQQDTSLSETSPQKGLVARTCPKADFSGSSQKRDVGARHYGYLAGAWTGVRRTQLRSLPQQGRILAASARSSDEAAGSEASWVRRA